MADAWQDVTPAGGWPWESVVPGPELASIVAGVDPQHLPDSARVSLLKACEALAGWTATVGGRVMLAVADASQEQADALDAPWDERERWLGDELAAALRVAPRTAVGRAGTAEDLLRRWPALGAAVAAGKITWSQGKAIASGVGVLDGQAAADGRDLSDVAVDRLLPTAGRYPPGRLQKRAEALAIALDPQAAARRRRRAQREETDVQLDAQADGLGVLWSRAPAVDAVAMYQQVIARARAMRDAAADPRSRTAGQWRVIALMAALGLAPHPGDTDTACTCPSTAGSGGGSRDDDPAGTGIETDDPQAGDAQPEKSPADDEGLDAADVMTGEPPPDQSREPAPGHPPDRPPLPGMPPGVGGPAPPVAGVRVCVVVDLLTLFGLTEDPGLLHGYGPIDPDLARALAADAEWVRWVTDPVTGHLLDAGDRRLPTARLRRFIHQRQTRCHHPSCGVSAQRCDSDHVPEYRSTGRTRASELAPGCQRHNQQRDAHGWTAQPDDVRDPFAAPEPIWTTPLGRSYRSITDPALPVTTAPNPSDHACLEGGPEDLPPF